MSCRMNPARSSSRWLAASASAGSSRRVGMWSWDQRMPANAPRVGVRCRPEDTCSGRHSQFDYRTSEPFSSARLTPGYVGSHGEDEEGSVAPWPAWLTPGRHVQVDISGYGTFQ